MPRVGITAYDLLISCPGDVEKYVSVIRESVEEFNRLLGRINNAEISCRHWSTDSYSQSGDKPQELLNKQFVRDCDAAVAIFWTKFGTPTDKYGSGTEEEIEEMLSSEKQVFMYFIEEPINPAIIDSDQYNKIKEFRERYKDRGIYFVVKNENELKKQFTNDMTMYFLPLIAGMRDSSKIAERKPILDIVDYKTETNNVTVYTTEFCNTELVTNKELEILRIIDELSNSILPQRTESEKKQSEDIIIKDSLMDALKSKAVRAEISKDQKEVIIQFAHQHSKELLENFWNVGNLQEELGLYNPVFGSSETKYNGTNDEKERFRKLENLYWEIVELNEYKDYFGILDNYQLVKLVITNLGTNIDEDIDIKLRIKKGKIVRVDEIPKPGIMIMDSILDMNFIENFLKEDETESISAYSDYPIMHPRLSYSISSVFINHSATQEYEKNKEKYIDIIENLYCYEMHEKMDEDIVTTHVSYLKHHTSMAFPSVLMFRSIPQSIEFEISSKHNGDVVKGVLKIE